MPRFILPPEIVEMDKKVMACYQKQQDDYDKEAVGLIQLLNIVLCGVRKGSPNLRLRCIIKRQVESFEATSEFLPVFFSWIIV